MVLKLLKKIKQVTFYAQNFLLFQHHLKTINIDIDLLYNMLFNISHFINKSALFLSKNTSFSFPKSSECWLTLN